MDFLAEAAVFCEISAISYTTLHRVYSEWCEDNELTALERKPFINYLKSNAEKYSVKYSNNIYENGKRVRDFGEISLNRQIDCMGVNLALRSGISETTTCK